MIIYREHESTKCCNSLKISLIYKIINDIYSCLVTSKTVLFTNEYLNKTWWKDQVEPTVKSSLNTLEKRIFVSIKVGNTVFKITLHNKKYGDFIDTENQLNYKWPNILSILSAVCKIKNETRLYFQALPQHIYLLKNDEVKGFKHGRNIFCATLT